MCSALQHAGALRRLHHEVRRSHAALRIAGTYKCVARCDPPLVACGAICIDTSPTRRIAVRAARSCPSGICQAGGCVGKGYGHEIVVGMDYADATLSVSSGQVMMLGNAIFQTVAPMVHVLAYDEFADAADRRASRRLAFDDGGGTGQIGRHFQSGDWTAIPKQLTVEQYQALLVYDQALAPADQMATTGTLWNAAMNAFAKGGGIVLCARWRLGRSMKDFLTNGGLLAVTDETDITGTQVDVDAPTDVVGQNLPNVLAAKKSTVAFTTTQMPDNYHVFVVTDGAGMLPVVVHFRAEAVVQTKLLDLLEIDAPIIQAPMAGVSTPEMAAAVSNAGALGSIGVGATNAAGARGR